MDLSKSYEYFQPEKETARIHIVGCGSVGSTVAENLVRMGCKKLTLWDFDTVEAHNIVNQMFVESDIGSTKVDALRRILLDINPEIDSELRLKKEGWNEENMSGYIFLCVDNIDLRRKIVEQHMNNSTVKAVFDFRTGLEDAQHYAADWNDVKMKQDLLNSMQFSHEEAKEETPVSACNISLGVCPTVRVICAYGVANFVNFVRGKGIKKLILTDAFNFTVDAF